MLVYTPQHTNRWTIFSAPLEQRGLDFDGNGPWIKRIRAAKTDTMRNRIECKQEGGGEGRGGEEGIEWRGVATSSERSILNAPLPLVRPVC